MNLRRNLGRQNEKNRRSKHVPAMERTGGFTIVATAVAVLAVLGAAVLFAQGQDKDKYSLNRRAESRSPTSRIRGLGCRLFCADRRDTQGYRRQSHHDHGVQGRRSGQRPSFPGWLHDREASMETEEGHGGPVRRSMCLTSLPRLSSWKRTTGDFRKPAGGDTQSSTTTPYRTSSQPIPRASRTAGMRAIRP